MSQHLLYLQPNSTLLKVVGVIFGLIMGAQFYIVLSLMEVQLFHQRHSRACVTNMLFINIKYSINIY